LFESTLPGESIESMSPEVARVARERIAAGYGPAVRRRSDRVALEFKKMANVGFNGVAFGLINYLAAQKDRPAGSRHIAVGILG
jgi:hypothetical protein